MINLPPTLERVRVRACARMGAILNFLFAQST